MEIGILSLVLRVPVRGHGAKIALSSALSLALVTSLASESFIPYSMVLAALASSSAFLADSRIYAQLLRALTIAGFRRDRIWLIVATDALFLSIITSSAGITWAVKTPILPSLYIMISSTLTSALGIFELKSRAGDIDG